MSLLDSGFPHFTETGFYKDNAPPDYLSTVRPGLGGLLAGLGRPKMNSPKGDELKSFLLSHELGKRLGLGMLADIRIDGLVGDAVERYLHLHGRNAPVDAKRRDAIIRPLVFGTVFLSLDLRLVVPITMTHFEVDHFRFTETTYIARMPKKLQLARARMSTMGSGAVRMVVGAATHAFVSNGWSLEAEDIDHVRKSLGQSSSNVLDATDTFLAR
jgi:hypothetical protein